MKGKDCPFMHPKRCSKLIKHGTKADKGCNHGKKCDDFHPKMCPMSIAKGVCFDDRCTLCHVKGTRRKKAPDVEKAEKDQHQQKASKSVDKKANAIGAVEPTTEQQSFLGQISLLKKELQEAMDLKISSLLAPNSPNFPHQSPHQFKQPQPSPMSSTHHWQIPSQVTTQMLHPQTFPLMQSPQMWYPPQAYLPAQIPPCQPQTRML